MKDILLALMNQDSVPVLTDTQSRIVQAALELFAEHGYTGARTQAIAEHAGVTEKTLFRHFGTKKQLFAQTIYPAMINSLEISKLREIITTEQQSLRLTLQAIIANRLAFIRENPDTFKLLAQELLLNEDFRDIFFAYCAKHLLPPLSGILKQAQARGELRSLPNAAIIRSMISLTIGYAFNNLLLPDAERDEDADIQILLDILLHGVGINS